MLEIRLALLRCILLVHLSLQQKTRVNMFACKWDTCTTNSFRTSAKKECLSPRQRKWVLDFLRRYAQERIVSFLVSFFSGYLILIASTEVIELYQHLSPSFSGYFMLQDRFVCWTKWFVSRVAATSTKCHEKSTKTSWFKIQKYTCQVHISVVIDITHFVFHLSKPPSFRNPVHQMHLPEPEERRAFWGVYQTFYDFCISHNNRGQ